MVGIIRFVRFIDLINWYIEIISLNGFKDFLFIFQFIKSIFFPRSFVYLSNGIARITLYPCAIKLLNNLNLKLYKYHEVLETIITFLPCIYIDNIFTILYKYYKLINIFD